MKVAIAQVFQETNTFSPIPCGLHDFERFGLYFGDTVIERMRGIAEIGAFVAVSEAEAAGVEIVPILRAMAWTSGKVTAEAMAFLEERLLAGIDSAGRLDGVLLSLHGSMVADGVDDVEGRLLAGVRRLVGRNVPIVASLDHHANVTRAMVQSADALVAYRECPHMDAYETGARATKLLYATLRGEITPVMRWQKLPMITPADEFVTSRSPIREWFARAIEAERVRGVVSASLFPVQPWLDVPELGWSTLVISDGDPGLASRISADLADVAWGMRRAFIADKVPPDEAVRLAAQAAEGPVVIADGSDSVNSGSPGDSTWLLKAMLDRQIRCVAFLTMVDPEVVEQAFQAGVGGEITVLMGGKRDNVFSRPVRVSGRVAKLVPSFKIKSASHLPVTFDMGRTVLLDVGSIRIVVTENPGSGNDPAMYRGLGIEPAHARIVVVKTPCTFWLSYAGIMKAAILADCPGLSPSNLSLLNYVKAPRPLFPLDEVAEWRSHRGASE